MSSESVWRAPAVIGGIDVWRDGEIFERRNPADTDQIVSIAAAGNTNHATAAVGAAYATFPIWSRWDPYERRIVCQRIAAALRVYRDKLADAMVFEVGKTRAGALGEVDKAIAIVEFYGEYDIEAWVCQPASDKPGVARYVLMTALGVVAIITAFNFPVALAIWKTVPAILAGNCVVYKPSEMTPYTAYLLMKVYKEAGVPDGVVNMVHGDGTIGSAIINHPYVRAVSFTGSVEVGNAVRAMADARSIPSVCEKGGCNAIMVMQDWGDRIGRVVKDVIAASFSAAGQRCTSAKRLLVHRDIYDPLVEELLRQTTAIRVGPGSDPSTMMEPLVSGVQLERVLSMVQAGTTAGMTALFGGWQLRGGIHERGHYMTPTVLTGDPNNSDHVPLHREVFGPVVTVVPVMDFDQGLRVFNGTTYGHCGALYTDDEGLILRFTNEAEVGMVHVCEHTLGGDADMPFGGMKDSMSGPPEMGHWGLDFFARPRAVYRNDGQTVVAATQR